MADRLTDRSAPAGIWTFIALDCTSFGLFFLVFMAERLSQAALFDRSSATLDLRLGLLNTAILLTSSWLVALANRAARDGDRVATRRRLTAAIVVASGFGLVKGFEYAAKLGAGVTVSTDPFFTFYFALTGVHLLHYLVGMVVLAVMLVQARDPAGGATTWLDGGSLYWHMVDLLWVFLFALLYLLGAR